MSKTVAITGATGVLGTHCCTRFVRDGWTVRGLCRRQSDRDPHEETVSWVVGDLLDRPRAADELVAGADVVVHLAGIGLDAGPSELVRRVTIDGTRTVLAACREHGVDRLVFASTAGTRRVSGTDQADEGDIAAPIGAYQQAKLAAEGLVDRYARLHGDAVTVHPTSVFGPGDSSFTAPLVAMSTRRSWPAHLPGGINIVGLSDVIDGIVSAIESGQRGGHYLLGGENVSYDEAVERIAAVAGGRPARWEVPASMVHVAGPVAAVIARLTGRRIFPYDRSMARLATQSLFYTSEKAKTELSYSPAPLEDHIPPVLDWLAGESPVAAVADDRGVSGGDSAIEGVDGLGRSLETD